LVIRHPRLFSRAKSSKQLETADLLAGPEPVPGVSLGSGLVHSQNKHSEIAPRRFALLDEESPKLGGKCGQHFDENQ
jgi:hypothetical protein